MAQWLEHDAAQHAPAFLYHPGDVVYYDGEHGSYYQQFNEPYLHPPAPIFAIPGNHDTDVGVPPNHTALEPFMANFCATAPGHLPDGREVERTTMIQPNYQRFQRKLKGRPDAHLHRGRRWRLPEPARPGKGRRRAATAPLDRPVRGFTLASYSKEHRHGFLRLSITKAQIRGVYNTVPRPQESWSDGPVATIDQFQIRIKRQ